MRPHFDFQDFARDCVRLARQQESPQLRSRLLVLAREWMHAAMQEKVGARQKGKELGLVEHPGNRGLSGSSAELCPVA